MNGHAVPVYWGSRLHRHPGHRFALALLACLSFAGSLAATYPHPGSFYLSAELSSAAHDPGVQVVTQLARNLRASRTSVPEVFDVPAYGANRDEQQRRVKEFQLVVCSVYVRALAHRLQPAEFDAADVRRDLLAWAEANRTITGDDGPVVMNYLGVGLLIATDLVWDSLSADDVAALRRWTREVFLRQAVLPELRRHRNNHRSWAIFAGLESAFILDDADLFAVLTRTLDLQIEASIQPDGRQPLELARGSRAGWYSYFSLAPLLGGVQIVRHVSGEDLWDAHDGRLEQGLRYLHAHYPTANLLGAGSRTNPANLFAAMRLVYPRGPWNRGDYLRKTALPDASEDQHIAWEFPLLFPARR